MNITTFGSRGGPKSSPHGENTESPSATSEFLASVVVGFLAWLPIAAVLTPAFLLIYWLANNAWGGLDQFGAAVLAGVLTLVLYNIMNDAVKR